MRRRTVCQPGAVGLALVLASFCFACDDDEIPVGSGSQIIVDAAPNPVHTYVDDTGTSVITVTLKDLAGMTLDGEAVELETTDGIFAATGTGMHMGVTMPDGTFTSTFSNGPPATTVFATITVRALDITTFHFIEVTDREPEPSTPSATHLLSPSSTEITDCTDAAQRTLDVVGRLEDLIFSAIQGASVLIEVKPGSAVGGLSGTFVESGTTNITATTGVLGLYPDPDSGDTVTFVVDEASCMGCGSAPGDCEIRLIGTFTESQDYLTNDAVITTDLP